MSVSSYARVPMLAAATACWGAGTVVTKQVLGDVAPLTLLPIQLAASCAFLLIPLLLHLAGDGHRPREVGRSRSGPTRWSPRLTLLAALGVLNPGVAYALGLLGLMSISASMSVLLWAAEPVLILLLAVVVLKDRIPASIALAVGVAVVGVLLVLYRPGAAGDARGIALTLAAVTACALYTVLARRLLVDDNALPVVLAQQAAALAFAVVLACAAEAVRGDAWSTSSMTAGSWVAAAASGVLYYGLAFWFYLAALRHVTAAFAGAFLPLVPVFGVAASYLVGERLTVQQWAGAVLVIGAVTVVAVPGFRRAKLRT